MSSLAVAFSLSAKTIYVNGGFADYTGHDGSTPELALHTIQDGINAASSTEMDTVLVAPGVYDQGLGLTSSHWFWSSRLLVNDKSVIIRSTDGAAKTFIVGQHGTGTGGYGDDIVRCVCVLDYSLNKTVIIEGFTLQNGATRDVGDPSGQGGALLATSDGSTPAFGTVLVDCVISNCIGSQSQVSFGGTLVRCRIEKNSFMVSPNYGAFYLCRGTRFLNPASHEPSQHALRRPCWQVLP